LKDELERNWKVELAACFKYDPGICLEGLKTTTETSFKICGLQAEIWTQDLPSTTW